MNRTISWNSLLLSIAMLAAAGLSIAMTPTKRAGPENRVQLETLIPKDFGEWRIDETIVPIAVSPEAQALIDRIYDQTLARTYVNRSGERVMLSIAYGGDQTGYMELHKPEVCYAGQGFEILRNVAGQLVTQYGELPVKRLFAKKGGRDEPITYWVTVGDKAIHPGLKQKLAQIRYGLTGQVPEGILVRVSTLSSNIASAYPLQEKFIREMLAAVPDQYRAKLTGAFGA